LQEIDQWHYEKSRQDAEKYFQKAIISDGQWRTDGCFIKAASL